MGPAARVAIVDDELPMRTALGRLLRLAGCEVTQFPSGEAFLASLDVGLPDCVILDLWMAGLSGLDVLRRLRAAGILTPVICISANVEAALEKELLEEGAIGVLRKPIPKDELLDAIRLALGQKH
jgi:two-component system, LuxR family, response regulator FixJ